VFLLGCLGAFQNVEDNRVEFVGADPLLNWILTVDLVKVLGTRDGSIYLVR
jgi:hypothetical protein